MKKYFRTMFDKIFFSIFFLSGINVIAQDREQEEMVTDRPDQTESSSLILKGFLQVETGGFYESYEESEIETEVIGYNTSLFRYGFLENLELRLGFNVQEFKTDYRDLHFDDQNTGISPLLLGAKIGIAEENHNFPEIAFMGHLYLPFPASASQKTETTGVDFRFAFSHTLSERSGLAYNIGAQWRDDNPEAIYIITLAYAFKVTQNFGVFAEYFADFPEDGSPVHSLDGGITYSLKPNIQLDAYAGRGLTENSYFLMGAGISFRIPN